MELWIEPSWAKKDTKFKKGNIPWNKGRKGWTTDDMATRARLLKIMKENLKNKNNNYDHNIKNRKPVVAYSYNGEYIGLYPSIDAAAEAFGVFRENIRGVLKGRRHHTGGYRFRHAELIDMNGVKVVCRDNIGPVTKKWARKPKRPIINQN